MAKNILVHISETKIFEEFPKHKWININFHYRPNWKNKQKENFHIHSMNARLDLFFPFLGAKIFFSKNAAVITPYGPLTPCWVPEKTKELLPRKLPDRRTNLDHRTGGPIRE